MRGAFAYMPSAHGVEVNESIIFRQSRGVSTQATSWWMNYKTTCITRVSDVSAGGIDLRSFIRCDNEIDAMQLREIMIRVGRIPQSATRVAIRQVD